MAQAGEKLRWMSSGGKYSGPAPDFFMGVRTKIVEPILPDIRWQFYFVSVAGLGALSGCPAPSRTRLCREFAHVRQERQSRPVFLQYVQIQAAVDATFALSRVGEDLPVRINDHGSSVVIEVRVAPDAVNTDDASLVLDGASLQKPHPMMDPLYRPVGNHGEQV